MTDSIRVSKEELFSSPVDAIIGEQRSLQQGLFSLEPTVWWRRVLFSSLFFLSVAGALGGFVGWLVIEPFMNESVVFAGEIDDMELTMLGDTQTWEVSVRGQRVIVSDNVTMIVGRNSFENVDRVDHLEVGLPVLVTGMLLEDETIMLLGTMIEVGEIPPDLLDQPLPDLESVVGVNLLAGLFSFAVVGACIAGCIAAADALVSRNLSRGLLCAVSGVGIAAVGGMIALIPAGVVFGITSILVDQLTEDLWITATLSGAPFMILMVGRSITWGVIGISVGLGQGIALRSHQLIVNGLLGGFLGGLVGGALFDPVDKLFGMIGFTGQAVASRGVGFVVIGISAGLMIGLVEYLVKDAWLLMRAGALTGKQFVIHKSPIVLGSSPKCDIYLFKDSEVDPRHAQIRKIGTRHEIMDFGSRAGTIVNGQSIQRLTLQDGDQISIGQTMLEYSGRAST